VTVSLETGVVLQVIVFEDKDVNNLAKVVPQVAVMSLLSKITTLGKLFTCA